MILDGLTQVCSAQQVTADAAGEDSYDLGNVTPKRRAAVSDLCLFICITAVGTNTGSSLMQFVESASSNLGTPSQRGNYSAAAAELVAGSVFKIPMSTGPALPLRYIGANFDITGTVDFTVDAYVGPASSLAVLAQAYARGYAMDIS
jgi:hypothetical protein